MYLGWYDPQKRKHVRSKLNEAIDKYREKFHTDPEHCLTSPDDAKALQEPSRIKVPLTCDGRTYIARNTFYIGDNS